MKITVMGLGLHGGGLASASYLLKHGAELTITDQRDEKILAPSIEKLEALPGPDKRIRYVLGRHETEDFKNADLVIKNPGVRPDSPYLRAARRIETDISLFLAASPARLIAVSGSKGKSSTASALYEVLRQAGEKGLLRGKAFLGGNITVSPLTFLDDLKSGDDVVLELSSWQLGDLKDRGLKPRAAVLTAIMPDHLDRYGTMEAYVADKRILYREQDKNDVTVAGDDVWGRSFLGESGGRPLVYSERPLPGGISGGWLGGGEEPAFARLYPSSVPGLKDGETVELVPARPLIPGRHQKKNLLAAGLALLDLGLPADFIRGGLGSFPGLEHRLEFFHEAGGIRFYNDSAATIPEAAAAALEAFSGAGPVVLVAGGADKNLDFGPLIRAAPRARALVLLAGTGSDKIRALLDAEGLAYRGPFISVEVALGAALEAAVPGGAVLFSPGCASFGMFLNEFDRGAKWKEAARRFIP
ncbi:MAG: UDP-N-acetylmuramoyl-L-alanine--D-glutamate ligase [Treponema sp.]|nr:UDP-N-acetylmuramoyl-L-alanine--D-glutamate ligase [Treponema sp.]